MTTTVAPRAGALSPSQLHHYETQGYLVLRQVFSATDMAAVAEEAEALLGRRDLIATDNLRCRWQPHVETEECLFETFDPVIDIGPVCARLASDPRLLEVLAGVYGGEACLFKDKLIFKPPGARGYNLHQDYISWPTFPRSFVTVLVAIDPAGRDNGCTEVFPGYHSRGYLSPADGNYHPIPPGVVDETKGVPLELEPGDIAVFGCFTPHRSAPNRSDRWRRQLYLSYNACAEGGERRAQHYQEFHAWLKERYAEYGKINVYFR
jgi:ectoine hydroxylase-related dioxygenase (phytanoyl-CoA dioxygenase family)